MMSNYNKYLSLLLMILFSVGCMYPLLSYGTDENGTVIFSAPWGKKSRDVAVIEKEEHEISGPLTFCVDDTYIFILDSQNRRVLRIDKAGTIDAFPGEIVGWGMCPDGAGGVYVQQGERVVHLAMKRQSREMLSLRQTPGKEEALVQGYGNEMFINPEGYPCVRTVKQDVVGVKGAARVRTADISPGDIYPTLSYRIKRMDGNRVRVIGKDAEGKALVSIRVRVDGGTPGAALFKGIDDDNNVYVEIENIAEQAVGLEVHRYSPTGERLNVYRMSNEYYSTVFKKTDVTHDGNVYQMLTTRDGVSIIQY